MGIYFVIVSSRFSSTVATMNQPSSMEKYAGWYSSMRRHLQYVDSDDLFPLFERPHLQQAHFLLLGVDLEQDTKRKLKPDAPTFLARFPKFVGVVCKFIAKPLPGFEDRAAQHRRRGHPPESDS